MSRSFARICCLLSLILGLAQNNAHAQSSDTGDAAIFAGAWQGDDHAAVRLLSVGHDTAIKGSIHDIKTVTIFAHQHWLGVEFRLAEGWHIYGRDPGEAGLPPAIHFVDSAVKLTAPPDSISAANDLKKLGFKARVLWPQDKRLEILGIVSRGYDQPVILPILLTDSAEKSGQKSDSTRSQNHRPYYADLSFAACAEICVPYHVVLSLDRNDMQARLEGSESDRVAELWTKSLNHVAAPEIVAAVNNAAYKYPPISAQNQETQATALGENAPAQTRLSPSRDLSLFMAIGLAFLGGIILNFMPCVLPVISLKLVGFARLAETDAEAAKIKGQQAAPRPLLSIARLEMGAIFIGIVLSFLLLGAVLAGLKLSGVAVGWGMQFQQPIFLGLMTMVLLVFSANLFGFFEIPLPLGMNRIFNWVGFGAGAGYGQPIEHRRRKIWQKAMATGILSTLLATPCSAPLVGTALTYALSRQSSEILIIFTAMGIGFAAFYGLAFLMPGLGRFMPKPGAWTVRLRQVLGGIMLLSAVWMGYLWLTALTPTHSAQNSRNTEKTLSATELNWQEFSPQKLAKFQAEQRIILVDVTARWCLTCKANEALVLNTSKTYELLTKANVVLLRADWTHANPMIAEYLAQNNRYGIPFNAIYLPNSDKTQGITQNPPILLPEILTFDALQQAISGAQSQRMGQN